MCRTKEKEFLLENQMQYHQKQKQFRKFNNGGVTANSKKKLQGREFARKN